MKESKSINKFHKYVQKELLKNRDLPEGLLSKNA